MVGATFDLVAHDDAQPTLPSVQLEGRITLTYGEPTELIGEFKRALRHDGKELVPCAGDRALLASSEILSAYQPESLVTAPDR